MNTKYTINFMNNVNSDKNAGRMDKNRRAFRRLHQRWFNRIAHKNRQSTSNTKIISHMLTSHGGEIFIHTLSCCR